MKAVQVVEGRAWCLLPDGNGWLLESTVTIEGQPYVVRVPVGDGRYLAQVVADRIVGPAISRAWGR